MHMYTVCSPVETGYLSLLYPSLLQVTFSSASSEHFSSSIGSCENQANLWPGPSISNCSSWYLLTNKRNLPLSLGFAWSKNMFFKDGRLLVLWESFRIQSPAQSMQFHALVRRSCASKVESCSSMDLQISSTYIMFNLPGKLHPTAGVASMKETLWNNDSEHSLRNRKSRVYSACPSVVVI